MPDLSLHALVWKSWRGANHGVVQQKLNEFTLHAACGRGEEGEKNAAPRRILEISN
jgi:hypothetical protein